MSVANNIRIRAVLNQPQSLINAHTSQTPVVVRGNAFAVQIGVFDRKGQVVDLTGHTVARLQLMSTSSDGRAPQAADPDPVLLYWDEESAIDNTLTAASWLDGSKQHLSFAIDAERSAVPVGDWWAVCWLETPTGKVTLFGGIIRFVNDGTDSGNIEDAEPLQELRDAAIAAAERAEAEADRAVAAREQIETIAGALLYRGTWANEWHPPEPVVGNFWVISAAVAFEDWMLVPWDVILFDGTGWQRLSIASVMAALGTQIEALRKQINNTKVAAGGISKTVSSALVLTSPIVLGTGDFDIFIMASCVPRGDTAADALLGVTEHSSGLLAMRRVDGQWVVRNAAGAAVLTAFTARSRVTDMTSVRLARAGASLMLTVGGEVVNIVPISGDTDFGTLAYIGARTAAGTEFGWLGNLRNLSVCNRLLDGAEAAELLSSGGQIVPPSARPLLPAAEVIYQSDFSAGLSGWNPSAAVVATPDATVGGVPAALLIEVTASSPTATLQCNVIPNNDAAWNGQYLVELDVYFPEENVTVVGLIIGNPSGDLTPYQRHAPLAKGQWHRVKSVANGLTGSFNSFMYGTNAAGTIVSVAGDKWAVKNMRVTRVGCVLDLPMDDGAGYQLHTRFGSRGPVLLPAIGVTHLLPGQRFEFVWSRVSSGFLGDADRPVLPDGAVIESVIWEDAKGTKTTGSLGYNASNTATHVASFTPAQARQPATLTAGSMATTDRRLYLNMSANAGAVTVRVAGRIL